MEKSSPQPTNLRRPHPLAAELIERLRPRGPARVLELGTGSGRNGAAMRAAGLRVQEIPDSGVREFRAKPGFDAAISTHALLHGSPAIVGELLARVAQLLEPGAPFYATFGSQADARYGRGTRLDDRTFAPDEGEERGVAHAFFDARGLREILEPHFTIESMLERNVDDVVGSWAHAQRPSGSVHWFVRARRLNQ